MQILMAVMMSTFLLMMVPRASVCADRITEVLATESSVVPPVDPRPLGAVRGVVDLDAVTFTYPGADAPVLREVSLRAEPGTTTAIVGSTGGGKSTLVGLVPRLYDVTGGAVRLDGTDVRDLAPEELWGAIGLVPQRAFLFSGSIADNLRHGRSDATDEELWEALEIAQARDFVERMPDGLDSKVAQGGTDVSGGQRQRLAIARALVKRPRVYLFDDAFSALDVATDARLRQALRPVVADATVIVVAQRVSTVLDADRIVVLEDGQVVGEGTHAELVEGCTTYQEIVRSQLTEEDAA
jgi:ATP-binding cassette subfamily B multidrug efflux pump